MRNPASLLLLATLSLSACATMAARPARETSAPPPALAGEYDNHAERWTASGGGKQASAPNAAPAIHHWLVHPGGDTRQLLWRVVLPDTTPVQEARWLLISENSGFVPYRPLTAEAEAVFQNPAKNVRLDEKSWAALSACTYKAAATRNGMAYAADPSACSALLPGIGATAALLPLRFELIDGRLRVVTVADQARGAEAATVSQRVRWFIGWDALNGGGAKASADNNDWHLRRDLRLHSEGGRVALKYRDGAASGYSLELARLTYRESNAEVLRLAVIEDASGKVVSYVWGDPDSRRIGLSLGWLQVGLEVESGAKDTRAQ
jgi:hypothetical protein